MIFCIMVLYYFHLVIILENSLNRVKTKFNLITASSYFMHLYSVWLFLERWRVDAMFWFRNTNRAHIPEDVSFWQKLQAPYLWTKLQVYYMTGYSFWTFVTNDVVKRDKGIIGLTLKILWYPLLSLINFIFEHVREGQYSRGILELVSGYTL